MSYQRLAYDDAATTDQMTTDCAEVGRTLHLDQHPHVAAQRRTTDHTHVEVSDELAELASGMQLHFD